MFFGITDQFYSFTEIQSLTKEKDHKKYETENSYHFFSANQGKVVDKFFS